MASPTSAPSSPTLQEELALAIRHEHTALNQLLSTRLPLCLPPHTSDPFIYAQGLCVVRHLYTGFEYAWETLLSQPPSDDSSTPTPSYLHTLRTPKLSRHLRLSRDVHDLSQQLGPQRTIQLEKLIGATIHFHKSTFTLNLQHPHLILAYAWTLYLAIFNGGRFIRAELEKAGSGFWGGSPDKRDWPLEFFNFAGKEDGNDVEREFKRRFDVVGEELSREEKDEVVAEAKRIFGVFEEVVRELDRRVVDGEGYGGALLVGRMTLGSVLRSPVALVGGVLGWVCKGWWMVVGACLGRRRKMGVGRGAVGREVQGAEKA
jgi:heme oxygenase